MQLFIADSQVLVIAMAIVVSVMIIGLCIAVYVWRRPKNTCVRPAEPSEALQVQSQKEHDATTMFSKQT